jgi:hypothetical protein
MKTYNSPKKERKHTEGSGGWKKSSVSPDKRRKEKVISPAGHQSQRKPRLAILARNTHTYQYTPTTTTTTTTTSAIPHDDDDMIHEPKVLLSSFSYSVRHLPSSFIPYTHILYLDNSLSIWLPPHSFQAGCFLPVGKIVYGIYSVFHRDSRPFLGRRQCAIRVSLCSCISSTAL